MGLFPVHDVDPDDRNIVWDILFILCFFLHCDYTSWSCKARARARFATTKDFTINSTSVASSGLET
jgi:hypothetical protein